MHRKGYVAQYNCNKRRRLEEKGILPKTELTDNLNTAWQKASLPE